MFNWSTITVATANPVMPEIIVTTKSIFVTTVLAKMEEFVKFNHNRFQEERKRKSELAFVDQDFMEIYAI